MLDFKAVLVAYHCSICSLHFVCTSGAACLEPCQCFFIVSTVVRSIVVAKLPLQHLASRVMMITNMTYVLMARPVFSIMTKC